MEGCIMVKKGGEKRNEKRWGNFTMKLHECGVV